VFTAKASAPPRPFIYKTENGAAKSLQVVTDNAQGTQDEAQGTVNNLQGVAIARPYLQKMRARLQQNAYLCALIIGGYNECSRPISFPHSEIYV